MEALAREIEKEKAEHPRKRSTAEQLVADHHALGRTPSHEVEDARRIKWARWTGDLRVAAEELLEHGDEGLTDANRRRLRTLGIPVPVGIAYGSAESRAQFMGSVFRLIRQEIPELPPSRPAIGPRPVGVERLNQNQVLVGAVAPDGEVQFAVWTKAPGGCWTHQGTPTLVDGAREVRLDAPVEHASEDAALVAATLSIPPGQCQRVDPVWASALRAEIEALRGDDLDSISAALTLAGALPIEEVRGHTAWAGVDTPYEGARVQVALQAHWLAEARHATPLPGAPGLESFYRRFAARGEEEHQDVYRDWIRDHLDELEVGEVGTIAWVVRDGRVMLASLREGEVSLGALGGLLWRRWRWSSPALVAGDLMASAGLVAAQLRRRGASVTSEAWTSLRREWEHLRGTLAALVAQPRLETIRPALEAMAVFEESVRGAGMRPGVVLGGVVRKDDEPTGRNRDLLAILEGLEEHWTELAAVMAVPASPVPVPPVTRTDLGLRTIREQVATAEPATVAAMAEALASATSRPALTRDVNVVLRSGEVERARELVHAAASELLTLRLGVVSETTPIALWTSSLARTSPGSVAHFAEAGATITEGLADLVGVPVERMFLIEGRRAFVRFTWTSWLSPRVPFELGVARTRRSEEGVIWLRGTWTPGGAVEAEVVSDPGLPPETGREAVAAELAAYRPDSAEQDKIADHLNASGMAALEVLRGRLVTAYHRLLADAPVVRGDGRVLGEASGVRRVYVAPLEAWRLAMAGDARILWTERSGSLDDLVGWRRLGGGDRDVAALHALTAWLPVLRDWRYGVWIDLLVQLRLAWAEAQHCGEAQRERIRSHVDEALQLMLAGMDAAGTLGELLQVSGVLRRLAHTLVDAAAACEKGQRCECPAKDKSEDKVDKLFGKVNSRLAALATDVDPVQTAVGPVTWTLPSTLAILSAFKTQSTAVRQHVLPRLLELWVQYGVEGPASGPDPWRLETAFELSPTRRAAVEQIFRLPLSVEVHLPANTQSGQEHRVLHLEDLSAVAQGLDRARQSIGRRLRLEAASQIGVTSETLLRLADAVAHVHASNGPETVVAAQQELVADVLRDAGFEPRLEVTRHSAPNAPPAWSIVHRGPLEGRVGWQVNTALVNAFLGQSKNRRGRVTILFAHSPVGNNEIPTMFAREGRPPTSEWTRVNQLAAGAPVQTDDVGAMGLLARQQAKWGANDREILTAATQHLRRLAAEAHVQAPNLIANWAILRAAALIQDRRYGPGAALAVARIPPGLVQLRDEGGGYVEPPVETANGWTLDAPISVRGHLLGDGGLRQVEVQDVEVARLLADEARGSSPTLDDDAILRLWTAARSEVPGPVELAGATLAAPVVAAAGDAAAGDAASAEAAASDAAAADVAAPASAFPAPSRSLKGAVARLLAGEEIVASHKLKRALESDERVSGRLVSRPHPMPSGALEDHLIKLAELPVQEADHGSPPTASLIGLADGLPRVIRLKATDFAAAGAGQLRDGVVIAYREHSDAEYPAYFNVTIRPRGAKFDAVGELYDRGRQEPVARFDFPGILNESDLRKIFAELLLADEFGVAVEVEEKLPPELRRRLTELARDGASTEVAVAVDVDEDVISRLLARKLIRTAVIDSEFRAFLTEAGEALARAGRRTRTPAATAPAATAAASASPPAEAPTPAAAATAGPDFTPEQEERMLATLRQAIVAEVMAG